MTSSITQIENLITEELMRANTAFPLFASQHEGYAVLLEEVEEACEEMEDIVAGTAAVWNAVRGNFTNELACTIDGIGYSARLLIGEAIQVAAMVEKFKMSMKGRE